MFRDLAVLCCLPACSLWLGSIIKTATRFLVFLNVTCTATSAVLCLVGIRMIIVRSSQEMTSGQQFNLMLQGVESFP